MKKINTKLFLVRITISNMINGLNPDLKTMKELLDAYLKIEDPKRFVLNNCECYNGEYKANLYEETGKNYLNRFITTAKWQAGTVRGIIEHAIKNFGFVKPDDLIIENGVVTQLVDKYTLDNLESQNDLIDELKWLDLSELDNAVVRNNVLEFKGHVMKGFIKFEAKKVDDRDCTIPYGPNVPINKFYIQLESLDDKESISFNALDVNGEDANMKTVSYTLDGSKDKKQLHLTGKVYVLPFANLSKGEHTITLYPTAKNKEKVIETTFTFDVA